MKLLTYRKDGEERVGILSADEKMITPTVYNSMNELICSGVSIEELKENAARGECCPEQKEDAGHMECCSGAEIALADVELLSPIPRPLQDVI
jgi:hypothetical protein